MEWARPLAYITGTVGRPKWRDAPLTMKAQYKPNGGNTPQAWFRRSRKRGPKGNAPSERHSLRIRTFPLSLKLNEPIAAAFRNILGQERRQADQNDEPQSIFLTKL